MEFGLLRPDETGIGAGTGSRAFKGVAILGSASITEFLGDSALNRLSFWVADGGCQTSYACDWGWGLDLNMLNKPLLRDSCDAVDAGIDVRETVGFSIDGAKEDGVLRMDTSDGGRVSEICGGWEGSVVES